MKILIVGDLHISGSNPICRLDDVTNTQFKKLAEIIDIANEENIPIINVGDVFDSPHVGYEIYSTTAELLKDCRNGFYCVFGNHDLFHHNIDSLQKTPLAALIKTVYEVEHVKQFSIDYNMSVDWMDWGDRIRECRRGTGEPRILVRHMAIVKKDQENPWKYADNKAHHVTDSSMLHKCPWNVIISGHWHKRNIFSHHGKLFLNPGGIVRRTVSEDMLDTFPSVVIFDTEDFSYTIIPLDTARKNEEVISKEHLVTKKMQKHLNEKLSLFIDALFYKKNADTIGLVEQIVDFLGSEDNDLSDDVIVELRDILDRFLRKERINE